MGLLANNGATQSLAGSLAYDKISVALTASVNNFDPVGGRFTSRFELSSNGVYNISGIAGGSDGRRITLENVSANIITLLTNSGLSVAANRFLISASVALATNGSIELQYSGALGGWIAAGSASGSGSASPGGSTTQVQFNDAGVFGGDTAFLWNKTTNVLTLDAVTPQSFTPVKISVDNTGALNISATDIGSGTTQMLMTVGFNDLLLSSSAATDLSFIFINNSVLDGASVTWSLNSGATNGIMVLANAANTNPVFSGGPAGAIMVLGTGSSAPVVFGTSGIARGYFNASINGFTLFGQFAVGESATAPATASSGTIATASVGSARVAPAAAVTGVILAVGTIAGQKVTVINQSAAANTITMAASGTSNVANGVGCVIAGLTSKTFTWNSVTALWYPSS